MIADGTVVSASHYTIRASIKAVTDAAVNNRLDIVEYLCTHRYDGYDSKIFHLVAAHGNYIVCFYICV